MAKTQTEIFEEALERRTSELLSMFREKEQEMATQFDQALQLQAKAISEQFSKA